MSVQTLYSAESWDKIYQAFEQVNFTSYDYGTIKEALLEYLKIYYPENFNDFIESSELVAIIEAFAYVGEMLAYRIDLNMHENSMSTAERKQSILRLAKFISYNATRNLPARGLLKITAISSSEEVTDSQGNSLSNRTIRWSDPTNSLWKEQFFLVMNRVMRKPYGQPSKAFAVDDVDMQLYEFRNTETSFGSGTFPYIVKTNSETIPMEVVCADIDDSGVFERYVDGSSRMNVLYAYDGLGDSSDFTGFMLYTKQGSLTSSNLYFDNPTPNRVVDLNQDNVNNLDVWVNQLDTNGAMVRKWQKVDTVNQQNIFFNTSKNRYKYEVETLEGDRVRLIFGDGEFSEIPVGNFQVWHRTSINRDLNISKSRVQNVQMSFKYRNNFDMEETCTVTFSLVNSLSNSAKSEDIEHIRRNAPQTYYSQNRMVNAQDYNTLMLRDSSILKLLSVNRTFAGQPKYLEWNDASGNYQNVKIFGDDLRIYLDFKQDSVITQTSTRKLIDDIIEPLLQTSGVQNTIMHQYAIDPALKDVRTIPRRKFVERGAIGFQEKTLIQGVLDSHYYGEPREYIQLDNRIYAEVNSDTDFEIWDNTVPRTVGGVVWKGGAPSSLQSVASQPEFGLRYETTRPFFGPTNTLVLPVANFSADAPIDEVWTIECINEANGAGTFAVTGSKSGDQPNLTVGEPYDNGFFSCEIPVSGLTSGRNFVLGDTFIVRSFATTDPTTFQTVRGVVIEHTNLLGRWVVINGVDLNTSPSLDLSSAGATGPQADNSWVIWVRQNIDADNNIVDYTVTFRDLKTVIESPTTKFWYNLHNALIDSETKKRVRDSIQLLKSNLNIERTRALGKNQVYDVVSGVNKDDGTLNLNALEVFPKGNLDYSDPSELNRSQIDLFSSFVHVFGATDFVYFVRNVDGSLSPVEAKPSIVNKSYRNAGASISLDGLHERKIGRDGLDFLWQHFSPNTNLIDPSVSNVIDIFVLTRGYYQDVKSWIDGSNPYKPIPPSSLELRNTYRDLLSTKMMSDTVIMHNGRLKLLFGELADPQLRAKFRAIKSPTARLTDDQIKGEILDVVNTFFEVENWDFGGTFHATQLFSLIHQRLGSEISSVVLVPTFVNNSFGSMFVVECGQDEIIQSCAKISDIEIVDAFTPTTLRQR